MKPKFILWKLALAALLLFSLNSRLSTARAQGTAFTYQGQLSSGTNPANGTYDFQFALSNSPSGGSQIGNIISKPGIGVTNGLFTTILDFSNVFNGQSAWLGISVRSNGTGSFTALSPLQQVTPTPYAVYAETASASNLLGTVSKTNLTGVALLAGGNAFTGNQSVTSGSAGIGISSPGAPLDVRLSTASGVGSLIAQFGSQANPRIELFDENVSGVVGPKLLFAAGNVGQIAGSGNLALLPTGNVGIGTTSPLFKLDISHGGGTGIHVAGPAGGGYSIVDIDAFNADAGVELANSGTLKWVLQNDVSTSAVNSFDLFDFAASQTRFLVQAGTGNVGIGTTTPANKLDVQGAADFNGNVGIGTNNPAWALTIRSFGYGLTHTYGPVQLGTYIDPNDPSGVPAQFGTDSPHNLGFFVNNAEPSVTLSTNGFLGIGTFTPANTLDVQGTADFTGKVGIGTTSPTTEQLVVAGGVDVTAASTTPNGDSGLGISFESYGGRLQSFQNKPLVLNPIANRVGIGTTTPQFMLDVNGEISCASINITSDRNAKEDFQSLNPRDVLAKVAALPITEWQYKAEKDRDAAAARHIGPMAQDFSAAFALGQDEKRISVVDEGGVALAAIQGLNQKLEETRAENAELKQTVSELKQLVEQLQRNLPASQVK